MRREHPDSTLWISQSYNDCPGSPAYRSSRDEANCINQAWPRNALIRAVHVVVRTACWHPSFNLNFVVYTNVALLFCCLWDQVGRRPLSSICLLHCSMLGTKRCICECRLPLTIYFSSAYPLILLTNSHHSFHLLIFTCWFPPSIHTTDSYQLISPIDFHLLIQTDDFYLLTLSYCFPLMHSNSRFPPIDFTHWFPPLILLTDAHRWFPLMISTY